MRDTLSLAYIVLIRLTIKRLLLLCLLCLFGWPIFYFHVPTRPHRVLRSEQVDLIFITLEYFREAAKSYIDKNHKLPQSISELEESAKTLYIASSDGGIPEFRESLLNYIKSQSVLSGDMELIPILASDLVQARNFRLEGDLTGGFFIELSSDGEYCYFGLDRSYIGGDDMRDYVDTIVSMREGFYFSDTLGSAYDGKKTVTLKGKKFIMMRTGLTSGGLQ